MKVEALIFDIGNVVVLFDWQMAEDRLGIRSGKVNFSARENFKDLIRRFEAGDIVQEIFVSQAARAIGFQGNSVEFIAIYNSIFSSNRPMERKIRLLAARFPLYLISNTSELHLGYLQQRFEVLRLFADGVYSFRAKCAKPDRQIFQVAAIQFGVTPENTVYIDDLAPNVETASDLGFRAIRYDLAKHAKFDRRLSELGILEL